MLANVPTINNNGQMTANAFSSLAAIDPLRTLAWRLIATQS
jgi:hypothetical protein